MDDGFFILFLYGLHDLWVWWGVVVHKHVFMFFVISLAPLHGLSIDLYSPSCCMIFCSCDLPSNLQLFKVIVWDLITWKRQ